MHSQGKPEQPPENKTTNKFIRLVQHPDLANNVFFDLLDLKSLAHLSAAAKSTEKAVSAYLTQTPYSAKDAKDPEVNPFKIDVLHKQIAILESIAKDPDFQFAGEKTLNEIETMLNALANAAPLGSNYWKKIKNDILLHLIEGPLIQQLQNIRETLEAEIQLQKKLGKDEKIEIMNERYLALSYSIPWRFIKVAARLYFSDRRELSKLEGYFSEMKSLFFKSWIFLFINKPIEAKRNWPAHLLLTRGDLDMISFGKQQEPGVYQSIETDGRTREEGGIYNAVSFAVYHDQINLARYLILKRGASEDGRTWVYGPLRISIERNAPEIGTFFLKRTKNSYTDHVLLALNKSPVLFPLLYKKLAENQKTHSFRNECWYYLFREPITKHEFLKTRKFLPIDIDITEDEHYMRYSEYNGKTTLDIAMKEARNKRRWELAEKQDQYVWSDRSGELLGIIQLLLDSKAQPLADNLYDAIVDLDVELVKLLIHYQAHKRPLWENGAFRRGLNVAYDKFTSFFWQKATPVDLAYKEVAAIVDGVEKNLAEEARNGREYKS